MSEKRLDAKNRWRNVEVAFRMPPEESARLSLKICSRKIYNSKVIQSKTD